jgi:hypothetical protein
MGVGEAATVGVMVLVVPDAELPPLCGWVERLGMEQASSVVINSERMMAVSSAAP